MVKKHIISLITILIAILCIGCASKESEELGTDSKDSISKESEIVIEPKSEENPRDLNEIKEYLATFPNELTSLKEMECYIVVHGRENGGSSYLADFCKSVSENIPARLVVAQFTIEGDIILDYLDYNGEDFYRVNDATRDAYAASGEKISEIVYPYGQYIEGTHSNGDEYKCLFLTETSGITEAELEAYVEGEFRTEELEVYTLFYSVAGNVNADTSKGDAWQSLLTAFDESTILRKNSEVTAIEITEGKSAEAKRITDRKTMEEILEIYQQLDVQPDESLEGRIGYSYKMDLYGDNDEYLQSVIPYQDAIIISGAIYDGSMNGTCAGMLITLSELFANENSERQEEVTYTQITTDEAIEMMETEDEYIILDVRTIEEYSEGHIIDAVCIPNETIGTEDIPELPEKEQLIMIYCRSGNRSKQAAEKLIQLGYTNVVEFGGIIDWKGQIEK